MDIDDDPLIRRAEAALVETARLREAHHRFRVQVEQQIERMKEIEAELDPQLPHPPWELGTVRAILAREEAQLPVRRAHTGTDV